MNPSKALDRFYIVASVLLAALFSRNQLFEQGLPSGDGVKPTMDSLEIVRGGLLLYGGYSPVSVVYAFLMKAIGVYVAYEVLVICLLTIAISGMYKLLRELDVHPYVALLGSAIYVTGILSMLPFSDWPVSQPEVQLIVGLAPWIVFCALRIINAQARIQAFTYCALLSLLLSAFSAWGNLSLAIHYSTLLIPTVIISATAIVIQRRRALLLIVLVPPLIVALTYLFFVRTLSMFYLEGTFRRPLYTIYEYSFSGFAQAFMVDTHLVLLVLAVEILAGLTLMNLENTARRFRSHTGVLLYIYAALIPVYAVLSLGPNAPFVGDVILNLFADLNLFSAIRVSFRWTYVEWFICVLFFGLGIELVMKGVASAQRRPKLSKILRVCMILALAAVLIAAPIQYRLVEKSFLETRTTTLEYFKDKYGISNPYVVPDSDYTWNRMFGSGNNHGNLLVRLAGLDPANVKVQGNALLANLYGKTDDAALLLRLLGIGGVIAFNDLEYPGENSFTDMERTTLYHQKGLRPIDSPNNITLFLCDDRAALGPQLRRGLIVYVGGFDGFLHFLDLMQKSLDSNSRDTASMPAVVFFKDILATNNMDLLNKSDLIVIENGQVLDLLIPYFLHTHPDRASLAYLWKSAPLARDWVTTSRGLWYEDSSKIAYLTLGDPVTTSPSSQNPQPLRAQFEVNAPGDYAMLIRAYSAKNSGTITAYVDNNQIATVDLASTSNLYDAYHWLYLGDVFLENGRHALSIERVRGYVSLDVVGFVETDAYKGIPSSLSDFKGRIAYLYPTPGQYVNLNEQSRYETDQWVAAAGTAVGSRDVTDIELEVPLKWVFEETQVSEVAKQIIHFGNPEIATNSTWLQTFAPRTAPNTRLEFAFPYNATVTEVLIRSDDWTPEIALRYTAAGTIYETDLDNRIDAYCELDYVLIAPSYFLDSLKNGFQGNVLLGFPLQYDSNLVLRVGDTELASLPLYGWMLGFILGEGEGSVDSSEASLVYKPRMIFLAYLIENAAICMLVSLIWLRYSRRPGDRIPMSLVPPKRPPHDCAI